MNTDLMFSSKDDSWETPPSLFNILDMEFNFTLDPCCTKQTAKCKKFFTKEEDGLIQDWSKDTVFVNPPYGREIGKWVEKSYNEAKKGAKVVMLIPSRTDTKWFHDFIYNKAEIRFLKGRIRFLQNKKELNAAPFPTMLIIFNK